MTGIVNNISIADVKKCPDGQCGSPKVTNLKVNNNGLPKDTVSFSSKQLNPACYNISNGWSRTAGYVKLDDKFSEEELAKINKSKKLPKGYYLQVIKGINHYVNGMPAGHDPSCVTVVKRDEKQLLKGRRAGNVYLDKFPPTMKFINDEKGNTYAVLSEFDSVEEAKSQFKKDSFKSVLAALGIVGGTIGLTVLLAKIIIRK